MNRRHALGLLLGAAATPTPAATRKGMTRAAFVVGISDYEHAPPLETPASDARLIAKQFRQMGYAVVLRQNPTREALIEDLYRFRGLAQNADLVALYIAGHGVQYWGETYLIPQDGAYNGEAFWQTAIPVQSLVQTLSERIRNKVVFVDTCRDLISPPARAAPEVISSAGLHATYSTQPEQVARDNINGRSPFAAALLDAMGQPGQSVDDLALQLRLKTIRLTQGSQVPWTVSTLMTQVSLLPETL